MSCPYEYYKEEETYYPRLYCNIDNSFCIYSKRCEKVYKFIPNDCQKECYKYIIAEQKNIPINSCFVQTYRKNKKGKLFLYVIVNDKVEKISTNLEELNQNYVYVRESIDGYEVSLIPFEEKKTQRKSRVDK